LSGIRSIRVIRGSFATSSFKGRGRLDRQIEFGVS